MSRTSPVARRRPRANFLLGAGTVALALATVLTGCGSKSDSDGGSGSPGSKPSSNSNVSPQQKQILAFYQCMRDNGVDMPDPKGDGMIRLDGIDPNDPAVAAALQTCQASLPGGGGPGGGQPPAPDANALEGMRKFTQCMRDKGINMPDPDPSGRMNIPEGVDTNSQEFQTANKACQKLLDGPILGGSG